MPRLLHLLFLTVILSVFCTNLVGNPVQKDLGRKVKVQDLKLPPIRTSKSGGSGVGNGGLFLISQIQRAINTRLLPLILEPQLNERLKPNELLLTEEEKRRIGTYIKQHGLPIVTVNPVDLGKGYYVKAGVPAKTRNGRLLNSAGIEVDARVVLSRELHFEPEIQLHEMAWNQYTWGGHYIPNSLLPHLFHEVIRFAFFKGLIGRNDDDSAISGRLITPETEPAQPDYHHLVKSESWLLDVPGNSYNGRGPCGTLDLSGTAHDTKRVCHADLALGKLNPATKLGKFSYEIRDIRTNNVVYGLRSSYRIEGNSLQFLVDVGEINWTVLRENEILKLNKSTQLYRIDRSAPIVNNTSQSSHYEGVVFCEDLGFIKKKHVFELKRNGINHSENLACSLRLDFIGGNRVILTLDGDRDWKKFSGRFVQIGYNVLVRTDSFSSNTAQKFPQVNSIYLQMEKGLGGTITLANGQRLFRHGTPENADALPVANGTYAGEIPCTVPSKKGDVIQGKCFAQISIDKPERGMVSYTIQLRKPQVGKIYVYDGLYVQAGTQLQILLENFESALSYYVGKSFLNNQAGSRLERAHPPEAQP